MSEYRTSTTEVAEDEIDLLQYWTIIWREKWGILGLGLAVCLLTIAIVFNMTPIYQSTATLLIEAKEANVVSIEEIYGIDSSKREYFATQFEILNSRQLAENVIRQLKLEQHPEFDSDQKKSTFAWRNWIPFLPKADKPSPARKWQAIVDQFQEQVQVQPIRNTQLVKISFESAYPDLTYKVANALGNAYIEGNMEARLQLTQKAANWLTGRLGGMRDDLKQSEQALQSYRERENLVDISGVQTLSAKEIDEITQQLVFARNKTAEAKNQLDAIGLARNEYDPRWETTPGVLGDPLAQRLKEEETEVERNLSEVSGRYGVKHPKLIAARSNHEAAVNAYQTQVRKVVSGFEKTYQQALADQLALEKSLARSKAEIQDISRKNYELSQLEREVQTSQQLYNMFFQRFKETNATNFEAANARFIDKAVEPFIPVKPKKMLIVALAAVLSGIVGIMLAFLRAALDNTIRAAGEIEEKLNQPVLGVLPIMKDLAKSKDSASLAYLDKKQHGFSEAVRTIRTGVILSGVDNPVKKLVVTSSIPSEGKTTLAMSIALSLGQMEKVVLIDADMRRPSIAANVGLDRGAVGLSEIIAGTEELTSCIYPLESGGIDLIPAGIVPPNPLELLSSNRFKKLLDALEKRYDRIIIDSAPTQAVSDSLVLSGLCDGVVYVVKADSTTTQIALGGLQRLQRHNAHMIGVVLNQFDSDSANKYGYYNHKGYYDYYGYGSSKGYG